jgi:hypothetical protein
MSKYEMTGAVRAINEPQTFASGFTKREFVIEVEDGKYPQMIKLECVKDGVKHLDGIKLGDVVNVSFDIRGSEYKERFYVNLVAWKVTATGETAQPNEATRPGRDVSAQEATRKMHGSEAKTAARDNSASEPDDADDVPFKPKPAIFQP